MKSRVVVGLVLGFLIGEPTEALCDSRAIKIVQARLLRCEGAEPYVESAAKAKNLIPDLARQRKKWAAGTVLVVQIENELRFDSKELAWVRASEYARFWWQGSIATCDSAKGRSIELFVHSACCDNLPYCNGAYHANLDYAKSVPQELCAILLEGLPASTRLPIECK